MVESDQLLAEAKAELTKPSPSTGVNSTGRYTTRAGVMRYGGAGAWTISQASMVKDFFATKYGRALPVSAFGQSLTHERLGFDHDDMVTTAMATLISTTVHCARCHEHKFDPVSQEEYYRLQAVFAGIDKAERAYDADPALGRRRQALVAQKNDLPSLATAVDASLLSADVQARVAEREKQIAASVTPWQVLQPESFVSAEGATLTAQPDGSVLTCTTLKPGRVDRSPCGTGSSANLAILHARGRAKTGDSRVSRSIIGGEFTAEILGEATVGGRPAVLPRITGRGYVFGRQQLRLDPQDPFGEGFALSDTWGPQVGDL